MKILPAWNHRRKPVFFAFLRGGRFFCVGAMLLGMTFAPAQTRADVLYVANNGDGTASQATSAGAVSTFATGLSDACAAEYDGAGNLYVSGASGGVIYQVTKQGSVSVFVTGLSNPQAMAFDANGDLYVANAGDSTIAKVDKTGKVSTFATGLRSPHAVAFAADGNLYAGNFRDGTIAKVTKTGQVSIVSSGFNSISALAFDRNGDMFVSSLTGAISKVSHAGNASLSVSTPFVTGLPEINDLAFDSNGDLFAAGGNSGEVFRITSTGVVSTFLTGLNRPEGLTFDHLPIGLAIGRQLNEPTAPLDNMLTQVLFYAVFLMLILLTAGMWWWSEKRNRQ